MDTSNALVGVCADGEKRPSHIIVASSTGAHAANLAAIAREIEEGRLDPAKTKVWCEKPLTDTDDFAATAARIKATGMEVSVGYILRFSGALTELTKNITEQGLVIASLNWVYGKDRRRDSRPSQGVLADEFVHPLSVTNYILSRVLGVLPPIKVASSSVRRGEFVDKAAQEAAQAINPSIPPNPISEVRAHMHYQVQGGIIPVLIHSSFLLDRDQRLCNMVVRDKQGRENTITFGFDADDGSGQKADFVSFPYAVHPERWSGDKAKEQMRAFLGGDTPRLTSLEEEVVIQAVLAKIASGEKQSTAQ